MREDRLISGITGILLGFISVAIIILLLVIITSCEKVDKNVCVLEFPKQCVATCYVPDENRTRDFYHYEPNTIHGKSWQECAVTCDTNFSQFMLYDCRDTQYDNYAHYKTYELAFR